MRITWVVIFSGLLLLTSCKQPDKNPELKDPIYLELAGKGPALLGKAEEQKKKIGEMKEELAEMPPRDPNRKRTQKQIFDMERGLVFILQDAKYFEVRAVQRLNFARKEYLDAFNAGKEWPDPAEYAEYQKRKALKEGPRSWEAKVPRLTRHLPPKPDEKAKPKEAPKPASH